MKIVVRAKNGFLIQLGVMMQAKKIAMYFNGRTTRGFLLGFIIALTSVTGVSMSASAAEVRETYPDGKTRVRYTVDEQKRKTGVYEEFYPGGKLKLHGLYALGKKSGLWVLHDEKGSRILESWTYRNDLLDGPYVWNLPSGRPGIKATYRAGQLYGPMFAANDNDAIVRRIDYPHSRELVEKTTASLLYSAPPEPRFTTAAVVKAPYKAGVLAQESLDEALNLTKLYRFLCGMPWQEMKVDPALSDKAGHATVLLARMDKPDMNLHEPEKPTDMDKAFLDLAMAGCKTELLHRGTNNPVRALAEFIDGSEGKDADKLEPRQWILSPGLQKVGFGASRRFVAMDATDGVRPAKVDYNFIAYPGEGYFPRVLLDSKSAWSLFINNAKAKVAKDSVLITVQKLDDHFQPVGNLLTTTVVSTSPAANAAFGWTMIVFKTELPSTEAARYWVGVSGIQTLSGSPAPFGYVVELIDVKLAEKVIVRAPTSAPAPPSAAEMKEKKLALFKSWLGKTVPDIQFSGRRVRQIAAEVEDGRTFQVDEAGETTLIKVSTDADGKVIRVTVDGQIFK